MNDIDRAGYAAAGAPMSEMVIAKFSPVMACVRLTVSLAVYLVCWFTILQHLAGVTALGYAWETNKPLVMVTFIGTPLMVWADASILQQIIFHQRRAVWIENGQLKYLAYHRAYFSSLPLGEIQQLSIRGGSFLRPRQIEIRTRQGKVDYITPLFLSGPAEAIQARLSNALSSIASSSR